MEILITYYRELTKDENEMLSEEQKKELRNLTVQQNRSDNKYHKHTTPLRDNVDKYTLPNLPRLENDNQTVPTNRYDVLMTSNYSGLTLPDILNKYKKHLTKIQYNMLSLYLIDGYTKQEIADKYKVTRQYVHKVWKDIRLRVERSGLLKDRTDRGTGGEIGTPTHIYGTTPNKNNSK